MEQQQINSVTSFRVAGEYFAFPTEAIRHILESSAPTRVPLAQPYVEGVINNHGSMVPVVSFRSLLDREPDDSLPEQCFVVIAADDNGKESLIGFRVDEMDDVFEYADDAFSTDVVIDVNARVQHAVAGTISHAGKFVYMVKPADLVEALL